ncbi:proline-, glutamic acid- and leucine-rich protein 1-like [Salvia splendens]|uniref:proline-, glutamic acid- and leucine-rich protein 1-like n=1 Tax=Salvia splendens TaxID=180675 RepID=UPI001C2745BB|nr:proline-, glutamic acid- and leucine-rich protein 1-like [Salvia splendens]
MAEFLRQQDLHRDWAAELANFSRIGKQGGVTGETPAVPAAEPNVQPTVQPPTSISTSSTTHPERESPSAATPLEPSEPSPTQEQSNSMEVDPISAYYDSDSGEREERRRKELMSREGEDEPERTPLAETNPQEIAREEIDLNETARKQSLMTDEEFEALLSEVTRMDDDTATMVEGLDLASGATETGGSDARTEVPVPAAPPVLKPKAVKRKLVLKNDPKAVRPKPKRVSQRCLGKWASSKARANTAEDPVEILSEEERTTPTKLGEESLSATDLEHTAMETEVVSPMPSDQGDETEQVAGGLDLAPESVGHVEQRDDRTRVRVETRPTAKDQPSTQAGKKPEGKPDSDEDRYQEERKRKGKTPVKRNPSTKRHRTSNIGIVITYPAQRTTPHHQEASDSDYVVSEESDSDSNISLEDEECREQQLPHNL